MQQAYQALKVIAEAQTIRILLDARPGELALRELLSACMGLHNGADNGIKAVILDFAAAPGRVEEVAASSPEQLTQLQQAIAAVPQPVLAVVRASLSDIAAQLLSAADFTLIAHEASIPWTHPEQAEQGRLGGLAAQRLGYATWTASAGTLESELERVLNMLRGKSAIALRNAKASVSYGQQDGASSTPDAARLASLKRINQFYLETVTQTADAREGLQAFLEKRQPRWTNR
jgi:enoyl-CoA hydratase/carnithine racemase